MSTIVIGRRHIPLAHVALVESFDPSLHPGIKSEKAFKARIVLIDRPNPEDRPDGNNRFTTVGRLLEQAGHVVSRVDPPYAANPTPELARWFGGASYDAEGLDRSLLDPAVRAHVRVGDQVRRRGLVKESDRVARQESMREFFAAYDVLLTPVLAQPPIAAARWGTRPWARVVAANMRYAPYAAPWNMLQYPAASVPAAGGPICRRAVRPGRGRPVNDRRHGWARRSIAAGYRAHMAQARWSCPAARIRRCVAGGSLGSDVW
jgi:Asp-tRNA(Asn)/Glu-tRNA(Gln) amidotransferase A subunit family amidase